MLSRGLWFIGLSIWISTTFAKPITLIPGQSAGQVDHELSYFLEDHHPVSVSDIIEDKVTFEPVPPGPINFGLGAPAIWLKFEVKNQSDQAGRWVLATNRALLDLLEIYQVKGGLAEKLINIDNPEARTDSYEKYSSLATSFELAPHEASTLLIRYKGPNTSSMDLEIWEESTFLNLKKQELTFFLFVLAAVGTLLIYNGVLYFTSRLDHYLYYLAAQGTFFAYYAHLKGFTTIYLWPDHPQIGRDLTEILVVIASIAMLFFARRFLNLADRAPGLNTIFRLMVPLAVIYIPGAILENSAPYSFRQIWQIATFLIPTVTWLTLPCLGLWAAIKWDRSAWPLFLTWSVTMLMLIYASLVITGRLPITFIAGNVYGVVCVIESLGLSIGLALHVRDLRASHLQTQVALNDSLKEQLRQSRQSEKLANERALALQELAEKGRLVQAAGHDVRQMVGGLRHYIGAARAIRDETTAGQVGDALIEITDQLDNVLSTTLITGEGAVFADTVTAWEEISAASLLQPLSLIYSPEAEKKGLKFRLRIQDIHLTTDRAIAFRILANLVSNAIKYTERGGLLVAIRQRQGKFCIQVFDTGSGLNVKQLESLINDGLHKRYSEGEGHGTGLQTVKHLVRHLGGEFQLGSVPDKGTCATIWLPDHNEGSISDLSSIGVDCYDENSTSVIKYHLPQLLLKKPDQFRVRVFTVENEGDLSRILKSDQPTIVFTYDRGIDLRKRLSGLANAIIYLPATKDSILSALLHLQQNKIASTPNGVL